MLNMNHNFSVSKMPPKNQNKNNRKIQLLSVKWDKNGFELKNYMKSDCFNYYSLLSHTNMTRI